MKNFKVRCSALSKIMTEPKKKGESLSETTKAYLLEEMIAIKYGRRKVIETKYTDKGIFNENMAIDMLSDKLGLFLVKNEDNFENDYITGTPDVITLDKGFEFVGYDLKCSFDIFTFFTSRTNELDKAYKYQNIGYMWLTGRKEWDTVFVLTNTPEFILEKQRKKIFYQFSEENFDSEQYERLVQLMERNHIYDDIPLDEKIFSFTVKHDNQEIEKIQNKIEICRNYLKSEFGLI